MTNEIIRKLQETLGITPKNKRKISEIKIGEKVFVSPNDLYFIIESSGQEFILFLNLDTNNFGEKEIGSRQFKIAKTTETEYILIEPNKNLNSANNFTQPKTEEEIHSEQLKKVFGISQEMIYKIRESLPKENMIQIPMAYDQEAVKEKEQIMEKFLGGNYARVAGRLLKENEKAKKSYSYLTYNPKPNPKIKGPEILKYLKENLIFDNETINTIFDSLSFEKIVTGKQRNGSGVVLFGPGGTGKSTILNAIMQIFEETLGSYVSRNEITKKMHSLRDVQGGKWRGAYEDHFGKYFEEAILEAKKRGVPSLICIDEGDEFVKPESERNSEQVQFWKSRIGNTPEIIVCIATNLTLDQLDPENNPAVREGRTVNIEIPRPNKEFTKKLILFFNNENKITLNKKLEDDKDFDYIAEIVVKYNKVGSNINKFCEEIFNKKIKTAELLENGYTLQQIVKMKEKEQESQIDIEDYKKRFVEWLSDKTETYNPSKNNENKKTTENIESAFSIINNTQTSIRKLYQNHKLNSENEEKALFFTIKTQLNLIKENINFYHQEKSIVKSKEEYKSLNKIINAFLQILEQWEKSKNSNNLYNIPQAKFQAIEQLFNMLQQYK